jgi:transposase
MINRSKRQLQRVVKRYREEGIRGLRFKSKRQHTKLTKHQLKSTIGLSK